MNRDSFYRLVLVPAATALAVLATGCVELEMEPLGETDSEGYALLGENGLTNNGLPYNGLPYNGLPYNGLPYNGLPYNGLPYNGLPTAEMDNLWDSFLNDNTDDGGNPRKLRNRTLMKYIIRCALADGASASFTDKLSQPFQWHGYVGVAPEWNSGTILPAHERWISACVASLVNSAGVSVIVSQRGPVGSRIDDMEVDEELDYTEVEGAYFGNVFADPPVLYSCRGPGYTAALNPGRSCSIANGNCSPMQQVGNCEDICTTVPRTDKQVDFDVYSNCDPDGPGGQDSFGEVVTIYLNSSN